MASEAHSSKVPFSLYDFFGYIFPGAYLGLMFLLISSTSKSRLSFLLDKAVELVYQADSVLSNILSASLLLVIAYSLGHIAATISHIVIDRLLVSGILGYPINRLLNLTKPSDYQQVKRSTSVYIFAVVLLILIGPVLYYHFGTRVALNNVDHSVLELICYPLYYRWLACLLCFFALVKVIHAFAVAEPYYNQPSRWLKGGFVRFCIGLYTLLSKRVFVPVIHVLETFLGTERRFPVELTERFGEAFKAKFNIDHLRAGTEVYWLAFFHGNATDPEGSRLVTNWLHIYGFARNMAASCFFLLTYILYRLHRMEDGDFELLLVLYVLNFYLMIFFVVRYWMIYSTYFSKSIVRLFYVNSIIEKNNQA